MRTRKLTGPLAVTVALAALAAPAAPGAQTTKDSSNNFVNGEYITPTAGTDLRSPDARDAADGAGTDLRSPDARDAADAAGTDLRSPDVRDAAAYSQSEVTPPIVEVTRADGFDWGDAGIGAAVAVGLLAISLAGAMTLRQHQARRRLFGTTR